MALPVFAHANPDEAWLGRARSRRRTSACSSRRSDYSADGAARPVADAEELLSFAVFGSAIRIDAIGPAAKPAGCAAWRGRTPGLRAPSSAPAGSRILDCGISSSMPVVVAKLAYAEDGRGTARPFETHSPGGRQCAAIQHVAIGVHRCKGCRLLISERPGCGRRRYRCR
jgi:hypothetical protein